MIENVVVIFWPNRK